MPIKLVKSLDSNTQLAYQIIAPFGFNIFYLIKLRRPMSPLCVSVAKITSTTAT